MRQLVGLLIGFFFSISVHAQSDLEMKLKELKQLKDKESLLLAEIETLKLEFGLSELKSAGYPKSNEEIEIIEHSGMVLGFNCDYKMASWTYHYLSTDITSGKNSRTNVFMPDEKVSCGSAVEADYFLKEKQSDGTFEYDGFGFDRGHLAPSADFSWSKKALAESYYYSNMTPQRPEFNRESWAELERLMRSIVIRENKNMHIITGPVLSENLDVSDRGINKLKIPDYHYKIIADVSSESPRGMAFLMPNKKNSERLSSYVVSIDSIESLTGIDFFPDLEEDAELKIETSADFSAWATQSKQGDVEPLNALELPKGIFNTRQAESKEGSKVSIVGKVVSTKFIPKSQSTFLNLDQSFPNQIFTVMIWKDGRQNFSYAPEEFLDGKYIVVTGKVTLDKNGIPGITVNKEEQIELWDEAP